ncbi:mitochondrial 54S ribosomal mL50 protein [Aspergillus ibericus CBS 121593]|uniref:Large ribosomal subunit protein mL50 n=1 Tax=Aspergillus ibericus CBS 121593 TaxID=1448316 RepID=A0A395GXF2_9EURO|nr:hypothetical protein BO80DRAFT_385031 [Aspergillus ibericus CBS 121593]RAK99718.1 hypothetical protein BO80DRAFT_385031 [Aspergillus ibericus CBS 121593]
MRPSLRLLNLEVPGSRALYVCSICRQEARPRPIVARQFLRHASSNADSLSERVRRKLWGTDNPPGLKDPYGESLLEKRFGKPKPQEPEEPQVEETNELAEPSDGLEPGVSYEPATTWHGLERVGHLGRWKDAPPSEADTYGSFAPKHKLYKKGPLSLAAHQAAVEISLMQALNRPLTHVCKVVEHDKPIFKLIWKTKVLPTSPNWGESLKFHNENAKKVLFYVFEQIGGTQPEAAEQEQAVEDIEVEEFENFEIVEDPSPPAPNPRFFGYTEPRFKSATSLPLTDPAIKFAFLKRFSQLSGHYFPDNIVSQITNVKHAMQYIQGQLHPKPTKLAEQLENDKQLQTLSNVKVFSKRQTTLHRDDEKGRRKLIESELRARGLLE